MKRRSFLRTASILSAGLAVPEIGNFLLRAAESGSWRIFDVTTQVQVLKPSGATRMWLPAALITATPFQKTLSNQFVAPRSAARLITSRPDGLGIVVAEFPAGAPAIMTLKSRVEKKQAGYFSACSLQLTRDTSQTSIARPANSFFAFPLDQPLFTVVFALATVQ